MATIAMEPKPQIHHHHPMTSATVPKLRFFPLSLDLGRFCTRARPILKTRVRVGARASTKALELVALKENWLDSLSCPFQEQASDLGGIMEREEGSFGRWVLGIDPDVSGAVAVLKDDDDDGSDDASGVSAQVFDTPHLQAMVGKRARKRLDAKSIVQLLHSFGAPLGTTAYIEQSTPFPQDGKQGWWSGGFTYGLWIGILVSSGFSVVPVSSRLWKDQFQLSRNSSRKDDSRKAASDLFPSLSSSLKRKKDHGRAEALLIAAYGKGLRIQSELIATPTGASEPTLSLENCTIGGQN